MQQPLPPLQQPLLFPVSDTSDLYGVPMDIDPPAPHRESLDDLTLTPEELAEMERRQRADDELRFVRALAEMSLGGPLDAVDEDAPRASDPLDELAEFEGACLTCQSWMMHDDLS